MGRHPVNLALRFFLEMVAFVAIGYWAWTTHAGILRALLVVLLPLFAAFVWGAFRVPNYGGAPLVRVPGIVRLLIEGQDGRRRIVDGGRQRLRGDVDDDAEGEGRVLLWNDFEIYVLDPAVGTLRPEVCTRAIVICGKVSLFALCSRTDGCQGMW